MALNDHKIINLSNPVASLPDHPSAEGMTAAQIKAAFDKSPDEIKNKINALIDNLLSIVLNDSGADNIGSTAIAGVNGTTVQAQLRSLKTLLDQVVLGQVPDNTLTNAKLAPAIKIGDLANLITAAKGDIVSALNEVKEQNNSFAPHLTDLITDADGAHGLKVESGTWTPTVGGYTTAGVGTYAEQIGRYTKIGNLVYIRAKIVWTQHTGTGSLIFSGLPFIAGTIPRNVMSILYSNLAMGSSTSKDAGLAVNANSAWLSPYGLNAEGGSWMAPDMDTAGHIEYSGVYSTI